MLPPEVQQSDLWSVGVAYISLQMKCYPLFVNLFCISIKFEFPILPSLFSTDPANLSSYQPSSSLLQTEPPKGTF